MAAAAIATIAVVPELTSVCSPQEEPVDPSQQTANEIRPGWEPTEEQEQVWNWLGDFNCSFENVRESTNPLTRNSVAQMMSKRVFERLYFVPHATNEYYKHHCEILAYRLAPAKSHRGILWDPMESLIPRSCMSKTDQTNSVNIMSFTFARIANETNFCPETDCTMTEEEFLKTYKDVQNWLEPPFNPWVAEEAKPAQQ